ncbi:Dextransucrase DSRB [Corchorus olitorius]|uniref:Dextransucrase DSRB n=1 Tax=Corchorus olitorius TaxID=93759 RepID=A0A1R3KZA9_9ROSI|nr:Dextransucrase DSRB [Corchorus olitorius]
MKVNDRVTVKTDGGPRRPGVVLAIEEFSEGVMYLVSLEDYPLGIWFFNELGHEDGQRSQVGYRRSCADQRILTKIPFVTLSVRRTTW